MSSLLARSSLVCLTFALAAQQPPAPAPTEAKSDALQRAFVDPEGHRRVTIAAAADQVLAADKTGRAQFMATLRAIAAAAPPPPPAEPATPAPASTAPAGATPAELSPEVRARMAKAVTASPEEQKASLAQLAADPAHGRAALEQLRDRGEAILARCLATFVRRKIETNAVFAGQYLELRDFQPEASGLLLTWAKEAPHDVANPAAFRSACLRALRDTLTADAATDRVRADLRELATDAGRNRDLWLTAVCALHQYGDPELFDELRANLEKEASSPEPEARASAMNMLAELWYQLRDYARAAEAYKAFVAVVEGFEPAPRTLPTLLYNTACSLSLAGKVDEALQYLERALDAGARTEQPLTKVLVDSDHDLDNLRRDPRFAALYARFFGRAGAPK